MTFPINAYDLPVAEWTVLLRDHHHGFIDWPTYESNQARLDSNAHPEPHQGGGALQEGAALLQGLAICGNCGRKLRTHYTGHVLFRLSLCRQDDRGRPR
jgi:hypothetical protein